MLDQIIFNCQTLITLLDNLEDVITFEKLNTLHYSVISIKYRPAKITYYTYYVIYTDQIRLLN